MPAAIPYTPPNTLTSTQAAHIASKARKALRAGLLTAHQFAVLEVLLWEARPRGSDRAIAAYSWLQKLARVCRQTAVDAIQAGLQLGLFRKIKRKTLRLWANGGRQWQQRPNEYVFCCESTERTEYPKQVIQILLIEPHKTEITAAQSVMVARQRLIETRLLNKGRMTPIK